MIRGRVQRNHKTEISTKCLLLCRFWGRDYENRDPRPNFMQNELVKNDFPDFQDNRNIVFLVLKTLIFVAFDFTF